MRHHKTLRTVASILSILVTAVLLTSVPAVASRQASQDNTTWYLAEGCTAYGFDTMIMLINPNPDPVQVATTFITDKGPVAIPDETIDAEQTVYLKPSEILGASNFSTKIECVSGMPIAVERWMLWPDATGDFSEGHSSVGVNGPSKAWYLAEGSSKWGFECWVLVQNPNSSVATVNLTYMVEGVGPKTVAKSVPANSRRSFFMADDIGFGDASVKVEANVPVIAERAMYRNGRREGHGSIGTTEPAVDYYLAEGTTDWGFTTYVLIQNPNPVQNYVTVTYNTESGPVADPPFNMPPNSRKTIRLNDAHPGVDLSTRVHGSKPLIAERAMYWDSGYGEACHDSVGLAAAHRTFYLPGGVCCPYIPEEQQPDMETWTLVQNPNNKAVVVTLSYVDMDTGSTLSIPANSRRTFNMADEFGTDAVESGIIVQCTTPGCNIMVEKANYVMGRMVGMDTIGAFSDGPPAALLTGFAKSGKGTREALRSMVWKALHR